MAIYISGFQNGVKHFCRLKHYCNLKLNGWKYKVKFVYWILFSISAMTSHYTSIVRVK